MALLKKNDYDSVLESMRLSDGTLWPMPITLDLPEVLALQLKCGDSLCLRDKEGVMLGVLKVEDLWKADLLREAKDVFGTEDSLHWGVHYLKNEINEWYVGGRIEGVQLPTYYDFREYRHTPEELKAIFLEKGWDKVVAFQTRNPIHKAHFELTKRAGKEIGGGLLIHPVVGQSKVGDIDHYTRVRCYLHVMEEYLKESTALSLLPLSMRMGGPREAVWHAAYSKELWSNSYDFW